MIYNLAGLAEYHRGQDGGVGRKPSQLGNGLRY